MFRPGDDDTAQGRRIARAVRAAERVKQIMTAEPSGTIEISWRQDGEVHLTRTGREEIR